MRGDWQANEGALVEPGWDWGICAGGRIKGRGSCAAAGQLSAPTASGQALWTLAHHTFCSTGALAPRPHPDLPPNRLKVARKGPATRSEGAIGLPSCKQTELENDGGKALRPTFVVTTARVPAEFLSGGRDPRSLLRREGRWAARHSGAAATPRPGGAGMRTLHLTGRRPRWADTHGRPNWVPARFKDPGQFLQTLAVLNGCSLAVRAAHPAAAPEPRPGIYAPGSRPQTPPRPGGGL